ncbi:MAG: aa3-type cytochrome c oxidase subunit IV [Bauldia sp.]|jgi:hypothetical protein|nr:aa3-type cytochrome c oxidase subunit IV [Bauldia sp.]
MARETEFGTASAADLAADAENHRRTYRGFVRLLTFASAGFAILLIIIFLLLQ